MLKSEFFMILRQTKKNIIGLMICVVLFLSGFFMHGNTGLYVNLSGFLIVIGGTLGATLLSYNMKRIEILFKVLKTAYTSKLERPADIVKLLVDLAVKRRVRGLLALEADEDKTRLTFLKQAIGLLVDGCSRDQIQESLNAEMYFFRMRRDETRRLLQTMADVAPSFGLVGSVVGLIGMLGGAGDSNVVMTTVPIALTSTLYGIVLANFIFLPFAATIRERTVKELFNHKLIADGVLAIADELHPRMVERKLKAFLTPSERRELVVSFENILDKVDLIDFAESVEA